MFGRQSRYFSIETAIHTAADGREIVYVKRRFLPPRSAFMEVAEHVVTRGDRLDNVTARFLRDPEQFWRLADANDAMKPEELTDEIGRALVIPLPREG
jgi:hypothetical protein